ncbi:adenosylcobinamide-GDP ribazoletransferase [Lichenifustis flavocetrariae]|uniref:Adenosylcobinamide-GDP ribazoletransferase n=1 Tax=Lichenifustis flavocetrariae TaxID=2949735 RepID=A0AA41YUG8_9HYPH|nr:adenosylcobinamide-GDP ribazoletransferase [Lichenifustis flavocetrariae]MCW6508796.1 adenosylcobinamide-GDP ribazoletransferase [Lichenifustis flavocetrariae]
MSMQWLRDQAGQALDATRFLSRLPVPATTAIPPSLATTLRSAPLAGVLIAAGPALLLVLAIRAGLPSLVAATLAIGSLLLATGALHEDGLADTADGFGGGRNLGRKLDIMRDSRIGTFGALALGTSLLLRVACLQTLVERCGPWNAALALLAAAVLSRAMMLVPLTLLPPARADGLARAAAPDSTAPLASALAVGLPLSSLLAFRAVPDGLQIVAALLFSAAAALGISRLARHHIKGVTGDVVGTAQQAAELAFLLTLCAYAARS